MNCEHVEGHRHDCAYVEWRNQLVDTAAQLTDKEIPQPPETIGMSLPWNSPTYVGWTRRWDAAFHRCMRQLTAPGLAA